MKYKFFIAVLITFSAVQLSSQNLTKEKITKSKEVKEDAIKDKHDLKMFPKANEGYLRYVINLPSIQKEQAHKVELLAGYEMEVDCNHYSLGGQFTEKILDGWGYPYFKFNSDELVSSTLMGCGNQKKEVKFVKAPSKFTYYSSRLPIVIYAPKNYEIKYAIWQKDEKIYNAEIE